MLNLVPNPTVSLNRAFGTLAKVSTLTIFIPQSFVILDAQSSSTLSASRHLSVERGGIPLLPLAMRACRNEEEKKEENPAALVTRKFLTPLLCVSSPSAVKSASIQFGIE